MAIPSHFQDWTASSSSKRSSREKSTLATGQPIWKRWWFIACATLAIITIIIVIAVPLAVLLPKRGRHHTAVLLPLYIYPKTIATWDPIYNAAEKHPQVDFIVVVNPNSGPGDAAGVDKQYYDAISKLSTYKNVEMVGYVRTGYGERNLSAVLADVSTYAAWSAQDANLTMKGIFFDESPHQFDEQVATNMRTATEAVKTDDGLQGPRTVIRNPGVIPNPVFADDNTDITVVFEQSYAEYQALQDKLDALTEGRSHYSYIVHTAPEKAQAKFQDLVERISDRAEFIFVTANADHYYESFGSDWEAFTDAVAK